MNKKLLLIIIAILTVIALLPQLISAANGDIRTIVLQKSPNKYTEHNNGEESEGTRVPSRPVVCMLTQSTIEIPGVDIYSIISFETYSPDGVMLYSSTQQEEFCNFIFTYKDELEIRLVTTDYILKGYLSE